jgi:hypothetical protein
MRRVACSHHVSGCVLLRATEHETVSPHPMLQASAAEFKPSSLAARPVSAPRSQTTSFNAPQPAASYELLSNTVYRGEVITEEYDEQNDEWHPASMNCPCCRFADPCYDCSVCAWVAAVLPLCDVHTAGR